MNLEAEAKAILGDLVDDFIDWQMEAVDEDAAIACIKRHLERLLTPEPGTYVMRPAKGKYIYLHGWCSICQKAKSMQWTCVWSDDPEAQELPELCQCDTQQWKNTFGGTSFVTI